MGVFQQPARVLMCDADRGRKGREYGKKVDRQKRFREINACWVWGILFLPQIDKKQEFKVVEAKGKEKKFAYRPLGKTGIKLPVINME